MGILPAYIYMYYVHARPEEGIKLHDGLRAKSGSPNEWPVLRTAEPSPLLPDSPL